MGRATMVEELASSDLEMVERNNLPAPSSQKEMDEQMAEYHRKESMRKREESMKANFKKAESKNNVRRAADAATAAGAAAEHSGMDAAALHKTAAGANEGEFDSPAEAAAGGEIIVNMDDLMRDAFR